MLVGDEAHAVPLCHLQVRVGRGAPREAVGHGAERIERLDAVLAVQRFLRGGLDEGRGVSDAERFLAGLVAQEPHGGQQRRTVDRRQAQALDLASVQVAADLAAVVVDQHVVVPLAANFDSLPGPKHRDGSRG